MENNNKKIYKLEGVVQHYSWGGQTFIPALLKQSNDGKKPFAEYWLGSHENAPSTVVHNGRDSLRELIRTNPGQLLGDKVSGDFGELPYLLKVLDVREMLSIQVHPSKKNAELGFAAENLKGVSRESPSRNYKDDNHKPELMYALSEFWLLHGFKPKAEIEEVLTAVPELRFLKTSFDQTGYHGVYQTVMELPQEAINQRIAPLLKRIIPAYEEGSLSKNNADFWAARAALSFNSPERIDRGIISIYLFNLVNLQPGQAIFQDAGIPHAYLEGQNIEIMANSDNVLRGGLTTKHIDVSELLRHVKYEETIPNILSGTAVDKNLQKFSTPAKDFELSRIRLGRGEQYHLEAATAEVFFVYSGKVEFSAGTTQITTDKGEAMIGFAGAAIAIKAESDVEVFRASVPYPHP